MLIRDKAISLVKEHTKNNNLIKHMYAVEAAMKAYAKKFGEDEEKWGNIGLIHDFDYEKFKENHPSEWGFNILRENGADEDDIQAIIGHGKREDTKSRPTKMAKTLFAVDELTGFIVACALVNPDKLDGVEVESVKRKFGKKEFAKGVIREDIFTGANELGVSIEEHIQVVLDAMKGIKEELGL